MTSETDLIVEKGKASIARSRARREGTQIAPLRHSIGKRSRQIKMRHLGMKLVRVVLLWITMLVALIALGLILPGGVGVSGIILLSLIAILGTLGLIIFPGTPTISDRHLLDSDIASLPAKTELWLEAQRASLPTSAQTVIDGIGTQLDTLADQLKMLDPREPAADEVRRLVGEHLPELVKGYQRVPPAMRSQPQANGGRSADTELVEGLKLIEREIRKMSEDIAGGDLDALATRGRYLEIKYQDDHGDG